MSVRAGQALRQQWADEARRAARARDPRCVAQDAAERAAMGARARTLERYGRLLRAALRAGELENVDQVFDRYAAAEERTARRLSAQQARIFGR